MALIQRITGQDKLGSAYPLRVAIFPHAVEIARKATDVVESKEIDDATNEPLIADLIANPQRYTLQNGVLAKDGQTIEVAGDGPDMDALKKVRQYVIDVRSGATKGLTAAQRADKLEAAVALILVTIFKDRVV